MEIGSRDTLLTLLTGAMLLVGIGLVLLADYFLTVVGIVLIVLSAIIFIVDAKDLIVKTDQHARK